jgi:hypothetical protein
VSPGGGESGRVPEPSSGTSKACTPSQEKKETAQEAISSLTFNRLEAAARSVHETGTHNDPTIQLLERHIQSIASQVPQSFALMRAARVQMRALKGNNEAKISYEIKVRLVSVLPKPDDDDFAKWSNLISSIAEDVEVLNAEAKRLPSRVTSRHTANALTSDRYRVHVNRNSYDRLPSCCGVCHYFFGFCTCV